MDKKLLVFNMYKDEIIVSKKFRAECKNKYKLDDRVISDLLAMINKYQIKKYGISLFGKSFMTLEDKDRARINSNSRRSQLKRRCWEERRKEI